MTFYFRVAALPAVWKLRPVFYALNAGTGFYR